MCNEAHPASADKSESCLHAFRLSLCNEAQPASADKSENCVHLSRTIVCKGRISRAQIRQRAAHTSGLPNLTALFGLN